MTVLKKIVAFIVATLIMVGFLILAALVVYLVMSYLRVSMIKAAGICWLTLLNVLNIAFPIVWGAGSLFFAPTIWRKIYLNLSA